MNPTEQTARVQQLVQNVPAPVVEVFDRLFATWKKTWFAGAMAFNSDTRNRTSTWAYGQLLDMGPIILPLVVAKLQDPQNFIAIRLYDDLQPDKALRVVHDPADKIVRTGLQGRAAQTVSLYAKNAK